MQMNSGLIVRDETGKIVLDSPNYAPIGAGSISAHVQFDRATAEARINALVTEYAGQSISARRMEVIERRALAIAMECMSVEVVKAAR
ncbi:hypothetical protein JFK97_05935 [Chromobacterium phragmitis]|uniref:hypothetical protein n=1 Tax=Chromobacterium amazonense TaxID=1382803 RepID=UPI0021B717D6|nr:hypothetical protein [Chromobacterium amazonense]MBM2883925.1 hypothetical protein [Chromobacterium amazonense]MDE1711842.1 hypothetical protein [Chromobacterium amazonense]